MLHRDIDFSRTKSRDLVDRLGGGGIDEDGHDPRFQKGLVSPRSLRIL